MRCPKYSFEINDSLRSSYCKNCEGCPEVGGNPRYSLRGVNPSRPKEEIVDPFVLARLLKAKEKYTEEDRVKKLEEG